MRYGHGTCTILQHLLKGLTAHEHKRTWQAPYQKPQLKSMAHGVHSRIANVHVLAQCEVPTQHEQSMGQYRYAQGIHCVQVYVSGDWDALAGIKVTQHCYHHSNATQIHNTLYPPQSQIAQLLKYSISVG